MLTQWLCRALVATIRQKGHHPCPRCLIPKVKFDLMGQIRDLAQRISNPRNILHEAVQAARRFIYQLGLPVNGPAVDRLLKSTSSVPTVVSSVCFFWFSFLIILSVECFHTISWSKLRRWQNARSGSAA